MFSYFVPNNLVSERTGKPTLVGVDQPTLESLGLGHIGKVTAKQITIGPAGAGWLLYRDEYNKCDTYRNSVQTWQPMPFPSDIWIGYHTVAGLPGPKDLARSEQLDGHLVNLGDDRKWLVPCAVEFEDDQPQGCALPRSLQINSEGEWNLGPVLKQYQSLWGLVCRYLDAETQAVDGIFLYPEINDLFVAALKVNYHVGGGEISMLNLLNPLNRDAILDALTDVPTLRAFLQKKSIAQGTGGTSDGLSALMPANPAVIDQHSPIGVSTP